MVSVVITTWNEEANLARAVKSVNRIADEVVVVDTQSTDNTVVIAKNLGCKVYTQKFPGIVEKVRNYSISKARGDWILLLDADEEVPESLAIMIKNAITSGTADYFRIPRKNLIFDKWITSNHWWPDYVYRLFRKGFIVWSDAIHSIPVTRGQGADFPPDEKNALIHHNYNSVSQYLDRLNRYTDFQLQNLLDQSIKFSWPLLISKPGGEFLNQFFSRQGYRDGIHGLALAGLQAFSELVLYLKLWQAEGFKSGLVPLSDFHKQIVDLFRQTRWWLYEVQGPVYRIIRKIKSVLI